MWVAAPYYSYDGKEWIKSNLPGNTSMGYTPEYANGLWIAGILGKGLWYSEDGKNWVQSNIATGNYYRAEYANGLWVAGSYNNTGIWYSEDGKYWEQSAKTDGYFNDVHFGGGIWVAAGTNSRGLWYSYDGKNWTATQQNGSYGKLAYINGLWVVHDNTGGRKGIYYSEDGKNWALACGSAVDSYAAPTFANGLWHLCDQAGNIRYSYDGKEWKDCKLDRAIKDIMYSVSYGGGVYLTCTQKGLYYSLDGINWSYKGLEGKQINHCAYANGMWVACGGSKAEGIYYAVTHELPTVPPQKWDNLLGRPFYSEKVEKTVDWNGNSDGLDYCVESPIGEYWLITSMTPTVETFKEGAWSITLGDYTSPGSVASTAELTAYEQNGGVYLQFAVIVRSGGYTYEGLTFEKPGVYVHKDMVTDFGSFFSMTWIETVTHLIPPEFLPKAAAVSDVTAAPTMEEFNALLAALRSAGYMAE